MTKTATMRPKRTKTTPVASAPKEKTKTVQALLTENRIFKPSQKFISVNYNLLCSEWIFIPEVSSSFHPGDGI